MLVTTSFAAWLASPWAGAMTTPASVTTTVNASSAHATARGDAQSASLARGPAVGHQGWVRC